MTDLIYNPDPETKTNRNVAPSNDNDMFGNNNNNNVENNNNNNSDIHFNNNSNIGAADGMYPDDELDDDTWYSLQVRRQEFENNVREFLGSNSVKRYRPRAFMLLFLAAVIFSFEVSALFVPLLKYEEGPVKIALYYQYVEMCPSNTLSGNMVDSCTQEKYESVFCEALYSRIDASSLFALFVSILSAVNLLLLVGEIFGKVISYQMTFLLHITCFVCMVVQWTLVANTRRAYLCKDTRLSDLGFMYQPGVILPICAWLLAGILIVILLVLRNRQFFQ